MVEAKRLTEPELKEWIIERANLNGIEMGLKCNRKRNS